MQFPILLAFAVLQASMLPLLVAGDDKPGGLRLSHAANDPVNIASLVSTQIDARGQTVQPDANSAPALLANPKLDDLTGMFTDLLNLGGHTDLAQSFSQEKISNNTALAATVKEIIDTYIMPRLWTGHNRSLAVIANATAAVQSCIDSWRKVAVNATSLLSVDYALDSASTDELARCIEAANATGTSYVSCVEQCMTVCRTSTVRECVSINEPPCYGGLDCPFSGKDSYIDYLMRVKTVATQAKLRLGGTIEGNQRCWNTTECTNKCRNNCTCPTPPCTFVTCLKPPCEDTTRSCCLKRHDQDNQMCNEAAYKKIRT